MTLRPLDKEEKKEIASELTGKILKFFRNVIEDDFKNIPHLIVGDGNEIALNVLLNVNVNVLADIDYINREHGIIIDGEKTIDLLITNIKTNAQFLLNKERLN